MLSLKAKSDIHIGHEAALIADQRKVMNKCSIVISVSVAVHPTLLVPFSCTSSTSADQKTLFVKYIYRERDAL